MYDAVVLNKVLYALSDWGGYISQALKDCIDASFQKAYTLCFKNRTPETFYYNLAKIGLI